MIRIRRSLAVAFLAAGCAAPSAEAQSPAVLEAASGIGRLDPTPAATLLLPYFEVDFVDEQVTTLFTVRNASAHSVVVHLNVYTDLAVPTIGFNLYLTGFDAQAFNLRDFFSGGTLPQTSPDDADSPRGPLSFPHQAPASCANFLPTGNLPQVLVTFMRQAHTGLAVDILGGQCAGASHGDGVARGFLVLDVVRECSILSPDNPPYMSDVIGFDNVLWGEYLIAAPGDGLLFGDLLVHVEAAEGDFAPGDYTFYGRFDGFNADDAREPLATSWAAPYILGGSFTATDLICWRDPGLPVAPFNCGNLPAPYPLGNGTVISFDEDENPLTVGGDACPLATQRVALDSDLPVGFTFGWLYLDLDAVTGSPSDPTKQAFVAVVSTGPTFQLGHAAVPLDNALIPGVLETNPEIFTDGFESGDTSAWSATVP